jgi:hypothetical protein
MMPIKSINFPVIIYMDNIYPYLGERMRRYLST